jgi:hypothetical protein
MASPSRSLKKLEATPPTTISADLDRIASTGRTMEEIGARDRK